MALVTLLGGWRATAFAALALLAMAWGGMQHWLKAGYHKALQDERSAHLRAQLDAQEERDRLAADLAAALRAKPRATKVIEVIRENPSRCSLPAPVHDSVLDQVRASNAARRGAY